MNKHFLNEKGITLVELLAALSLFAIVSALVMTVLFNVFRNSENISDNAQLRQDANLLVSTLRSHYNQDDLEEDKFEVSLENGNILLIDGQEVNSSMTSSIAELKLENGENSISAANDSMIVKADGTPLSIDLTLKNEAGQTYSISTTIEKPAELEIALKVFKKINKPDPPLPPPLVKKDFKEGDYGIDYDRDTKYAKVDSNQFIPDGFKENVTITGNVWFSDDHHNVVDLKHDTAGFIVTKNLFVDPPEFNVDNKHPMKVGGDAVFKGRLELKEQAKFIATNIHAGSDNNGRGVVVGNKTQLEATGSIVADGSFEITSQVTGLLSEIGGNLFANKLLAREHARLNIGENLIIDGNLEMSGYKPQITVEENAIIGGDLILGGNSNLTIKGNAIIDGALILGGNSNLKIIGDLTVKGEVRQDDDGNNGTLHVGGKTNFSKGEPDWLKDY
ncbi:hypothetical protein BW721_01280 [Jeotgalibaca sp. PTS2502]|uniref:prepilin-type N-terminal cleavage/methylation domain-containing protein n=1 Tax=Jeotgalibaca sp. PTS2502 TaxID=1903686 RepID=UPI000973A364|nr:prepilin-type N-terminal cleavage/methylation domain-containing protein [Jeotgalibaca sp. PTS2502]APZ48434.1 hypothetical protein BW721_01280 [Jeotgalibaca sp. PTS2502]